MDTRHITIDSNDLNSAQKQTRPLATNNNNNNELNFARFAFRENGRFICTNLITSLTNCFLAKAKEYQRNYSVLFFFLFSERRVGRMVTMVQMVQLLEVISNALNSIKYINQYVIAYFWERVI